MYTRIANHYQSSKRNFKFFSALIAILLLISAIKFYGDIFSPNIDLKYTNGRAYIYVYSDKNYNRFLNEIQYRYYLKNGDSFRRLANFIGLETKLKPGKYPLTEGMSNWDIIKMLIKGRQEPFNVVFKYADRKTAISRFFATQLESDSNLMNSLLSDTSFVRIKGFDTNTVLCMFIPNTYNFYWNTNAMSVLDRMLKEYKKFWTAQRLTQAIQAQLTPIEVSILASIVQKETNKYDEMPVVAGVYINRLKRGIPLQADPTVIYAWNDDKIRRVTNVQTAINSPYNTYLNAGLPPGPICTPSVQAIEAVLNYQQHQYIYFCAKPDFSGYHSFAETLEQHNQNARKYQHALNVNGIK